jgi:hypothetical protein
VIILPSPTTRELTLEVKAESNGADILMDVYRERANEEVLPHQIVLYDGAKGYLTIKEAYLSRCTSSSSATDGLTYSYTFIYYQNISFKREA